MKVIYFLLTVFLLTGCTQNNKIPKGILSQQKMQLILWDMIRADEYANSFIRSDSATDLNQEKAILYEQIFKLHSTKADIYKKSLTFYQSNPALLKVISDSLRSYERKVLEEKYNYTTPTSDSSLPENLRRKPVLIN